MKPIQIKSPKISPQKYSYYLTNKQYNKYLKYIGLRKVQNDPHYTLKLGYQLSRVSVYISELNYVASQLCVFKYRYNLQIQILG